MNDGSWGELKVIRKGSQDTPNTYYFLEVINSNVGSFQPCEIIDYVYHKSNQQPFGSQASTKSPEPHQPGLQMSWHQVQVKHKSITLDRQRFMLWHFLSTSLDMFHLPDDSNLLFSWNVGSPMALGGRVRQPQIQQAGHLPPSSCTKVKNKGWLFSNCSCETMWAAGFTASSLVQKHFGGEGLSNFLI